MRPPTAEATPWVWLLPLQPASLEVSCPLLLPSHVRYSLPWLHCGYCRVQRQSNRCCAGLVLAPMNFAEEDAKGLQYIPSMALGECLGPHFPHSSEVTSAV